MELFRLYIVMGIIITDFALIESRKLLTRSPERHRKEKADSIPTSDSDLVDDFSEYPDVIVAIQKAGLSVSRPKRKY